MKTNKCQQIRKYYKENKQFCLGEITVDTQEGCSKEVLLNSKLERGERAMGTAS